jgi:hypothetical protein
MITHIKWHKTSEELPKQSCYKVGVSAKTGKDIVSIVDDDCLVIFEGKIKRSKYLKDSNRWEGHTEEQIPEYWVKIKELRTE